jgi:hypothetical protein
MANFFAKSKAETLIPSTGHKEVAEVTDFDKVFKQFALRKGVEVAPINHFGTRRGSLDGVEEDPIVVLDEETPLLPPSAPVTHSPPAHLPGIIYTPLLLCILTKSLP